VLDQTAFLETTLEELRKSSEELTVLRAISSKKSLQNVNETDDPISILDAGG
jgi:hypothetical protein